MYQINPCGLQLGRTIAPVMSSSTCFRIAHSGDRLEVVCERCVRLDAVPDARRRAGEDSNQAHY